MDLALTDIFVSEAMAFSFAGGLVCAAFFVFLGMLLSALMSVLEDRYRLRHGLPVARLVRWQKEQDIINKQ